MGKVTCEYKADALKGNILKRGIIRIRNIMRFKKYKKEWYGTYNDVYKDKPRKDNDLELTEEGFWEYFYYNKEKKFIYGLWLKILYFWFNNFKNELDMSDFSSYSSLYNKNIDNEKFKKFNKARIFLETRIATLFCGYKYPHDAFGSLLRYLVEKYYLKFISSTENNEKQFDINPSKMNFVDRFYFNRLFKYIKYNCKRNEKQIKSFHFDTKNTAYYICFDKEDSILYTDKDKSEFEKQLCYRAETQLFKEGFKNLCQKNIEIKDFCLAALYNKSFPSKRNKYMTLTVFQK